MTSEFPRHIEARSEFDVERIEKTKNDIRNALIMFSCTDMDGFVSCMSEWLDKNDEKFEAQYNQLLNDRPTLLDEWETADLKIRDEILNTLNGALLEDGSDISQAA